MRYASVGGLVACLAVAAGVMWGGGKADAAGQLKAALENQAKAKTVRGTITITVANPPPGTPGRTVLKFYGEGSKARMEDGPFVTVSDGTRRVVFDHAAKVARFSPVKDAKESIDFAKAMAANVGKIVDSAGGKDKVMPAAEATIGGEARPGLKVAGAVLPGDDEKVDVTIWLDRKRNVPLRIEYKSTGPIKGTNVSDYVYDENLDPKLFDMTPPVGYKVETLDPTDGKPVPAAKPEN